VTQASARWALHGEAVVALVGARPGHDLVQRSLHPLPGPTLVIAERFTDSPVGPFSVLSVGMPVRLGLRPAWHYFVSVISSTNARRAGRAFWGFPHQLGTLSWVHEGDVTRIRWEEQELSIDASTKRGRVPFLVPMRSAQVRGDGPVVVPQWMRGSARRADVEISSAEQGPGSFLHGCHQGVCISSLHVRRSPARVPSGIFTSLRAPLGSPDPGVAGMRDLPMNVQVTRKIRMPGSEPLR
jgi:hypothetical protein